MPAGDVCNGKPVTLGVGGRAGEDCYLCSMEREGVLIGAVKGSEGLGVNMLGCGECVLTCKARKPVCLQLSG